jgi:DNA-binding CsgD family transcriptional regulator
MPLGNLLNEIIKMKIDGKKVKLLSDKEDTNYSDETNSGPRKNRASTGARSLVAYGLGSKYGSAYFTKREAECMVLLLKGKTISSVANILNLSPRTVEYYIKNMKSKLGCRTKFELVDLVYASEFMKNVDF